MEEKVMRRIVIAIVSLAFSFVFLCLMVAAWGSWHGFFSNPARTALVVVSAGLFIAALFTDSSGLGSGVREDRSNRWVLFPLIASSILMVWLAPYLDRCNAWVWGGEAVRWIGVVLTLVGGCLRLAPVFALGRRFSGLVAIQPNHKLKTDGLYRVIRHPSYLGLLIGALGWMLVFRCVEPGLILTAVLLIVLIARMNSEERLLQDQFGVEYAEYKKRTWRLIPELY
jgi:protein-S-isoprenylcysteine O-methyltransferase Ste14